MSLDEQLQALSKVNSEEFTYEMLLGDEGDELLDTVQTEIIEELNDNERNYAFIG